jgi:cell surface protein SprA
MFSFQTNMNRRYNERLLRSKSIGDVKLEPTYLKNWDWNRNYSLQYDLTKSIKLDYTANANAYIDEPPGEIDRNADNYRDIRDTIMQEIYGLGSINKFNHVFNASYDVPLNKIPLFDFTSIQARYSANYTWQASPESVQARLGNSIENSNNIQVNGSFRLSKLYSKVGYIKKMEQESRKKANQRRSRMNPRRPQPKQQDDSTKNGANIPKLILDNTIRILTGIKDVSVNYTETNGTRLPGFTPEPDLLGNYLGSTMAPGLGFVFGSQEDIRFKAAQNGWLTSDTLLNNPYMLKSNDNLSYRLQFEPFKDFKIELTGNRTRSENHTEYFRADADGIFQSYNPVQSGSFSSSIITWKTAFEPFNDDNVSAAYDQMKENRQIIARRLADVNPWSQGMVDSTGYPDGYSAASQQVILPAFLAAYTGSSAESIQTSPFINFPLPNWRITFNGLTNIPFVKKYIKSLAISHSYRSSYTVGQYVSNVNYQEQAGAAYARNQANDFYPKNEIGLVTISEQLSPLIGFDATLHNSLMARFEIKKSRNLSLSFTNNQMTEVKSNEIVIGTGYRIKDIAFFIKSMAGGKNSSRTRSDLNIKLDLSIKDNKTILRRIDEDVAQISAGRKMFTLNATADYNVNQKFNLRFYFNTNVNSPYISTQFPTSNTEGGISMTFSL